MACTIKREKSPGRRLGKIEHGSFVAEYTLHEKWTSLTVWYMSNMICNFIDMVYNFAIQLLRDYHGKKTPIFSQNTELFPLVGSFLKFQRIFLSKIFMKSSSLNFNNYMPFTKRKKDQEIDFLLERLNGIALVSFFLTPEIISSYTIQLRKTFQSIQLLESILYPEVREILWRSLYPQVISNSCTENKTISNASLNVLLHKLLFTLKTGWKNGEGKCHYLRRCWKRFSQF